MRNTTLRTALLFISTSLSLHSVGLAQDKRLEAEKIYAQGMESLAKGDTSKATKTFKRTLKADKNFTQAYVMLGKLAFAREDWDEVNGRFNKVLDRDPDNLEAHYYRGIANREIGKFRPKFVNSIPLLNKMLEFQKAEKYFKIILAADSLFRDVVYQYALLQRYRGKFEEAVQLGERQIALRPELTGPQIGIFNLYRHLITRRGKDEAISWLAQQPWDHAQYFIAEKLRREKKIAEADSILHQLLSTSKSMSKQPILLSIAKCAYARNRRKTGEIYYWRAVDEIKNDIDAGLVFEEIKYILSDSELHAYRAAKTPAEQSAFFRALWAKRNPMPATEVNLRLAEHFRRLVYAEDNYEYEGFRSWVRSADKIGYLKFPEVYTLNHEFNDKGLVYLRHGPPDDRIATVDPTVPSNESWKYWKSGQNPEMTFHFIYDDNVSGNLWTLTSRISYPAMLADRATWDPMYQQLLDSPHPAEQLKYEDEIMLQSKVSVATGFSTDRYSWNKKVRPLNVPFSVCTYREASGKTAVEVYFGVPVEPIADLLVERVTYVPLQLGLAFLDNSWRMVKKLENETTIPIDKEKASDGRLYLDLFRALIEPGTYRIGFHVMPKYTDYIGGFSNLIARIPDYNTPALIMSDIELAATIEPAESSKGKFIKNGLLILPNPSHSYPKNKMVYVYFEVYNLTLDTEGKARFSVEYRVSKLGKMDKTTGKRRRKRKKGDSISFRTQRESDATFSAEYLAIDASKLKKGDVQLEITITDNTSGQQVKRENRFRIL